MSGTSEAGSFGGSDFSTAVMVSTGVSPLKARAPLSIS
jgi:hypothetical protein